MGVLHVRKIEVFIWKNHLVAVALIAAAEHTMISAISIKNGLQNARQLVKYEGQRIMATTNSGLNTQNYLMYTDEVKGGDTMAQIIITTTAEEQAKVLEAIKQLQGETVPVAEIARVAKMNQNRVRYVITDLLEAGKITREASKAYNKHYIRDKYFLAK